MTSTLATPSWSAPRATGTLGVVGAGPLTRMVQRAAVGLGLEVLVRSPPGTEPVVTGGSRCRVGRPDDRDALADLAARCEVVTVDPERTPIALIEDLVAAGHTVRPGPAAARIVQDRVHARVALAAAGYPVARFEVVAAGDRAAVERFGRTHGWPVVVKQPAGAEGDRGVHVCLDADHLPAVGPGRAGTWLLEEQLSVAAELTAVIARRPNGHWVAYPLIGRVGRDGTGLALTTPARVPAAVAEVATVLASSIAAGIDAVGILVVELCLTADGDVLVDEVTTGPRTSSHATIDACVTSEVENHVRAVLDWPLGAPDLCGPAAATVSVVGPDRPLDLSRTLPHALQDDSVRINLHAGASTGAEIGHVTAIADDVDSALDRARRAAALLVAP